MNNNLLYQYKKGQNLIINHVYSSTFLVKLHVISGFFVSFSFETLCSSTKYDILDRFVHESQGIMLARTLYSNLTNNLLKRGSSILLKTNNFAK